jgi:hypothetical protein
MLELTKAGSLHVDVEWKLGELLVASSAHTTLIPMVEGQQVDVDTVMETGRIYYTQVPMTLIPMLEGQQ